MNEPEFKNLWKKRAVTTLECPGGSVCQVTRPGPGLSLRIARLQRTLKPLLEAAKTDEGEDLEEAQGRAVSRMTDEDERATLAVARETVAAAVVRPKLYLDPDPDDPAQIGVDDIDPKDFWFIFKFVTTGSRAVPVALQGGETTSVDAVENFPRPEGAGVGAGDHGGDLPESQSFGAAGD